MSAKDRVREEIAKIIVTLDGTCFWETITEAGKVVFLNKSDQILKIPGLVVLSDDQELPKMPETAQRITPKNDFWFFEGQNSLKDAGFRRVIED